MSRIRTIKPEFWTSEQVMECSTEARLLFIGLWNFCDDAGRHPMSPKRIKAQIFPADDFTGDDVLRLLDELASAGLISYYSVDGNDFFHVTGWKHQRIDRPQPAKYPAPSGEHSTNETRTLATEGKGREGKIDISPALPPVGKPGRRSIKSPAAETDAHWQRFKAAYPKRKGDYEWKSAREKFDRMVLGEGVDPELIIAGAARYAQQQREMDHENTPFIKQASSFLAARTWEEFPAINGKDAVDADWRKRLGFARQRRTWDRARWGPMPNEPGCLVPPAMIESTDGTGWAEWGEGH